MKYIYNNSHVISIILFTLYVIAFAIALVNIILSFILVALLTIFGYIFLIVMTIIAFKDEWGKLFDEK
jgi:hypothetical protein